MLFVDTQTKFKRDLKKAQKQGKPIAKLEAVIENLCSGITLETKYRNHALSSNWAGYYECHIEPDWLLIYKISKPLSSLDSAVTQNCLNELIKRGS